MNQQEQENQHPNTHTELADLIRSNMTYQRDQSEKRTLLKDSMLKLSMDKDFQHLFAHSQRKEVEKEDKPVLVEVSEELKQICQWLQESTQFTGMAYLPFGCMSKLLQVLHQKMESLAIVVTEYPSYWINKMEQLGRLAKLKWGCISVTQSPQDKVRVLELYELKKLKLLFIPPSLFRHEQYHEFECELLLICDLHLYTNQSAFLSNMIAKTKPSRVLALYHTLMPQSYQEHCDNHFTAINTPVTDSHSLIVLKTTQEDKFKLMMLFLSKNQYKRTLIIVNERQQAANLNKKLLMEARTSVNLLDLLTPSEIGAFVSGDLIGKIDRENEEEKVVDTMRKLGSYEIVICKYYDFFRFGHFDLAIYYNFTDVAKFVDSCCTVDNKLLLLSEDDYHNTRNLITAELVTMDNLSAIVMRMVSKNIKKENIGRKRYYSGSIDDKLLDCYSISKQQVEKEEEKVIKMNSFCCKTNITQKLFMRILETLDETQVVSISHRSISQIQIHADSLQLLKRKMPQIEETRRKVNILNCSSQLQKTTRCILDQLKQEGIKYRVTEEAIQIKLLMDYDAINWKQVFHVVNDPITRQTASLDRSLETFKLCAYRSIELTKREKVLERKNLILSFLKNEREEETHNTFESFHRSNLLTSEIEEWLRHTEECVDEHQLVLLLQGVQKGRIGKFKTEPVFGRYRKFKHEELMEAVTKIYHVKKVKLD